ncbi:MAG: hypothetical protein ACFFAU_21115 [Candidatus Hodarchaeota archaeon]
MRTTIKLDAETKERLRQYKLAKSKVKEKDLTYNDAVKELLDDSLVLAEWMGSKRGIK